MATERSESLLQEEVDHLVRSIKKVKLVDGDGRMEIDSTNRSFKQTLVWGKKNEEAFKELGNVEKVVLEDDETWSDDDEMSQGDILKVSIDKEWKSALRRPWCLSVIIKVRGKSVSFITLQQRLPQLWRLEGEPSMVDLGQGFYVVKFSEKEDLIRVLTGGPWKIMDHYLLVQHWQPNFRPSTATFKSTSMWIRLPELPIEYFQEDILLSVAKLLGKPLKMDTNTTLAARGKYARICVEIDLSRPLVSKVQIGNLIQVVEHEALHTVCFDCGIIGHRTEHCPKLNTVVVASESGGQRDATAPEKEGRAPNENFGPWMLVQRKPRKPFNYRSQKEAGKGVEDSYNCY